MRATALERHGPSPRRCSREAARHVETCISYQLVIRVSRGLHLQVGRLGAFDFPPGTYVYTGSAKKNLEARVARHLSPRKTARWHIDYLLMSQGVSVRRVLRSNLAECDLNRAVAGHALIPGFGASDCRSGCGSHLKRLPRAPTPVRPATPRGIAS